MATVTINATAPIGSRIAARLVGVDHADTLRALTRGYVGFAFLGHIDFDVTRDAANTLDAFVDTLRSTAARVCDCGECPCADCDSCSTDNMVLRGYGIYAPRYIVYEQCPLTYEHTHLATRRECNGVHYVDGGCADEDCDALHIELEALAEAKAQAANQPFALLEDAMPYAALEAALDLAIAYDEPFA